MYSHVWFIKLYAFGMLYLSFRLALPSILLTTFSLLFSFHSYSILSMLTFPFDIYIWEANFCQISVQPGNVSLSVHA